MRARIHRGAAEIGGSCVELEACGERLVVDVGRPLDADIDTTIPLPAVDGLADGGNDAPLGVVVSHGHPDHYGLADLVHSDIPIYMGGAAHQILEEAAFFSAAGTQVPPLSGALTDRATLQLGPFRLTPFLVDHSAFDAYALLVEADGRRLFYSGDLRAHGRKAAAFERLLREPPKDIHTLILEGTRVHADGRDRRPTLGEKEVEDACRKTIDATAGMVLALYSPQNIDRLVTFYKAARRSGRELVLDLYAATVARATGTETVPQAGWDGIRVLVPQSQRVRVKRERAFERVNSVRSVRIFPEEMAARAAHLVTTFRASMIRDLERAGCLEGASAIWSMWPGYLERDSGVALTTWLDHLEIPLSILHASGHASVADLCRLAEALTPERLVPIHTSAPERYRALFTNVDVKADREWWTV